MAVFIYQKLNLKDLFRIVLDAGGHKKVSISINLISFEEGSQLMSTPIIIGLSFLQLVVYFKFVF
jgi:hypothetical protein